ncbi:MAG: cation-translocating P-type ATPase [Streptococcaceae bacterium]|jgi:calcium-translocating P-type ATPase|nr:cation-translocating P-type ATPase [Streptococcaceae bacterium]
MLWVKERLEEVITRLDVDTSVGLTNEEVQARLSKYGKNEFDEEKKETILEKVLHHLKEITAIILLIAAGIAGYMAITTGIGWSKVWVILSIVVINIVLGIYQESRAEQALEALKNLNSHKTTVIREGRKLEIDASELVPGDIVELSAGDMITADSRLIESSSLQVEEAPLTGESEPVDKDHTITVEEDVPLGDRLNMVYSGCLVTNGRAKAVVVETGMNTEMGKIAGLLNNTQKLKTPLQIRLHELSKRLCIVALGAGAIIFMIGVFLHGESFPNMLLVAVSLGVAAVPETLPIIVTMVLSHGVHNMVRKNTIIRRIPAVETVGNTSVICSDKTGTLTQNKMKIQQVWHVDLDSKHAENEFCEKEIHLVELLASCSNATIEIDGEDERVVGDPTEAAIIRLLHDKGLTRVDAERQYPRVFELPFDSTRKRMTTVHHDGDGYIVVTKGAFDSIPVLWTEELLEHATAIHDEFASKALRVISIGYKKYDQMPTDLSEEALEKDLHLLGLVGMIDPPRPESTEAVRRAKEAGIRTVMITGDHVMTAKAIAAEIGIYQEGDRAVTGAELNHMTEEDLRAQVKEISVYARVSPEDKIRIVQAWQSHGEVIAMTGDGVNDAPALKAADVGAAMGITGTEVSKNAADMVITDDNFATIVDAIEEGRTSFDNIKKTIYFLLSVNFSQIFIMLTGVIMGWGAPLTAIQILLINVISDGIPGFFIAFEKGDKNIMKRKPMPKNAGIFSGGLGTKIAARSLTFAILTLGAFMVGMFLDIAPHILPSREVGVSMAFIVLSWASVINIFNIRSEESIFKIGFVSNKGILLSSLISMLITLLVASVPVIAGVFQVVPLSLNHWLIAGGLALLQLVTGELHKLFARSLKKEAVGALVEE